MLSVGSEQNFGVLRTLASPSLWDSLFLWASRGLGLGGNLVLS